MTVARWPARITLAILVATLAAGLVRLGLTATWAIAYPYDLDYGEGVVWHQMNEIMAGRGYAPLGFLPAIVFEYPPLFHMITGALAAFLGADPLATGRSVALAGTLASGALVAAMTGIVTGGERGARTAAVLAGALFLVLPVTMHWAALMRVDTLALAITLAGMIAAARAARDARWGVAAGLAFAAALYAKQTALPAPAGAFLVLLATRPRAAWTLAASAVLAGGIALALIDGATGGGFLTHIVGYNINRVVWAHGVALGLVLLANLAFLALAAMAWPWIRPRLSHWRDAVRTDPGRAMIAVLLAMLAIKTLLLPAILKSGASDNYLLDWLAPLAVLAGLALRPLVAATDEPPRPLVLALAGIALPIQLASAWTGPVAAVSSAERMARDRIAARIAVSAKPVIGDQTATILRGGQPLMWEPAILAELGVAGRYDDQRFAALVRSGSFGFFLTEGAQGDLHFGERYNPKIAAALAAAYPVRERVGRMVVHLPAGGWPAVRTK